MLVYVHLWERTQLSEYRSVFGDLTSRVVEPLVDLGFGPKDLAKFFSAVQVTAVLISYGITCIKHMQLSFHSQNYFWFSCFELRYVPF